MKKIFTLLLTCAFATGLSAQNFMKFDATDGNDIKALNGLAHRTGASQMEILVPANFDLTNVNVDYQIAETDELVTNPLPTNYTQPQKVTLKSATNTKEWTITFKKVKPAELPLALDFSASFLSNSWTADTQGWAAGSIDPADNNAKVVRFGNVTSTFITAFSDPAKSVAYKINGVGTAWGEGIFDVFVSADGKTWETQTRFDSSNPMPIGKLTDYSFEPANNIRYVKWVYTNRVVNVTMNNILIEKGEPTGIENESADTNQMYVNNNELVLSDNSSIAKVEIFSLVGSLVHTVKIPNNTTNLSSLTQGIYIAKTTSVNGVISTLKFAIN